MQLSAGLFSSGLVMVALIPGCDKHTGSESHELSTVRDGPHRRTALVILCKHPCSQLCSDGSRVRLISLHTGGIPDEVPQKPTLI